MPWCFIVMQPLDGATDQMVVTGACRACAGRLGDGGLLERYASRLRAHNPDLTTAPIGEPGHA
jgi:hypothetical protein